MRIDGVQAFAWTPTLWRRRNRGVVLAKRPRRYWMVGPSWAILWDWIPHEGLWAWRLHRGDARGELLRETPRPERAMAIKKRAALGLENTPIPALSMDSKTLDKLPLLREFLCVTSYEDGSIRTPGSLRLDNKIIAYMVTLYDPDAGMRLPVSGLTLDDVLKAVERLLGAPDAPWEVDRYLTEQLGKKRKTGGRQGKK